MFHKSDECWLESQDSQVNKLENIAKNFESLKPEINM